MNAVQYDKSKRNCFLAFVNKKLSEADGAIKVARSFAARGYTFEKTSFVTYDNSTEIMGALSDGVRYHRNIVIYCPTVMVRTFKDYFQNSLSSEFDGLNILKSPTANVFLLVSDSCGRLTVSDICDFFDKFYGTGYGKAFVKTVGAPRSLLDEALKEAKSVCPELEFTVTDDYGDCSTEITYGSAIPKSVFDGAYRALVARLNGYIYALEDVSLAERLVQLLKLRRMKFAVAESFTGGGVGGKIVEVSGASEVFIEGVNAYANESKMARLGVDELTLKQYGAVSAQTAEQMAMGLVRGGVCDVSVSTTGIAGPKSDNTKKPVGLAYIAVGRAEGAEIYEYNLKGTRKEITQTAINLALFAVYKSLK